jgi:hypothetical protein
MEEDGNWDGVKTLVAGDTHLKARMITVLLDGALAHTEAKRLVILGDYCDAFNVTDKDFLADLTHLADWVKEKQRNGLKVELLYGNHDLYYLFSRYGPGTRARLRSRVTSILVGELRPKIAAVAGGWLLTHAGVTARWAKKYLKLPDLPRPEEIAGQLNALLREGYFEELLTCGPGRGGLQIPSPLWADSSELEKDPLIGLRQIVGHSAYRTCCRLNLMTSEAEAWICDTFGYGDGSMLLVDGGAVSKVAVADYDPHTQWRLVVALSNIG